MNATTAPSSLSSGDWRAHAGGLALPTIGLLVAIVAGQVVLWVLSLRGALPIGAGFALATVLAYTAFTVMHEASHGNIDGGDVRFAALEEVLGWAAGAVLFVPYAGFRVMHLLHHAHTNDPERDPDHWVASSGALWVILRCWTIVPAYYVDLLVGASSRTVAGQRARPQTFAGLAALVAVFVALCAAGLGRQAILLWLIPALAASGLLALAFDWLPHHPHAVQGRYRDTRVLLIPGATLPLLWQNYHLIHHLHPRVPFYRYGRCFRDLRPQLERVGAPIEGFGRGLRSPFSTDLRAARGPRAARVVAVDRVTADAVAIRFEPLGWRLEHRAGQFVTVHLDVDGQPLQRCYSLFTAPGEPRPGICVKRVRGGRASGWLNEHLQVGATLRLSDPAGRFVYDPGDRAHLVLVGGGSGITPLLAIGTAALAAGRRVALLYGNRSAPDIILREAIDALHARHPDRFAVRHLLSNPPAGWTGGHGRLDPATAERELAGLLGPDVVERLYYVCGPSLMMEAVRAALSHLGVPDARIREERFVAPPPASASPTAGPAWQLSVSLGGRTHTVRARRDETLLSAALRGGVPIPHACGAGQCGTCMVEVVSGEVEREEADALLATDVCAGRALACRSRPHGPVHVRALR